MSHTRQRVTAVALLTLGSLTFACPPVPAHATPRSSVSVQLRADLARNVGARVEIALNRRPIRVVVADATWRTYTTTLPRALRTGDEVELRYTNDAVVQVNGRRQDRNLHVRSFVVDSRAVSLAALPYDLGNTWSTATDGRAVTHIATTMKSNGALRDRIPAATSSLVARPQAQTSATPAASQASTPAPTSVAVSPAPSQDPVTSTVVAPNGAGATCSSSQPCSLETGLRVVRERAATAASDLSLVLKDGTYRRTTPLTLGDADSGHRGHRVVWRAAPGAHPVVDGSLPVTGWTSWTGRPGVVRAKVPVGTRSRQLYVNGQLAERASAPAAAVLGTVTKKGESGYTISSSRLSGFSNLTDTELVWSGAAGANVAWDAWTESRCPVASASATTVTPAQPCYALAGPTALQGVGLPTSVENNLALLTRPGQFYLDSHQGYVYYMPRRGESSGTLHADLPVSQGLVRAAGVHDLLITGIGFSHDTWLVPSTPTGYADVQAGLYKQTENNWVAPPAMLSFTASHDVRLEGVTIGEAGATGVSFADHSRDDAIINSTVAHTAGSGIGLGGVDPGETDAQGFTLRGDEVAHTGQQYRGAVGIFLGYVHDSAVSHNRVHDTSYTGISAGWGWGTPSALGGLHIDQNRVERVMQSDLIDGGAIYVNGVQRSRSSLSGNLLVDDPQPFGGIYLDASASQWDVQRNVVQRSATNWVFLQDITEQAARHNTVTGNWTDSSRIRPGIPGANTISGNTVASVLPAAGKAVADAAG